MQIMPLFLYIFLTFSLSSWSQLIARQGCMDEFQLCMPKEATASALPMVGPGLDKLYTDIINAINSPDDSMDVTIPANETGPARRQTTSAFCCALGARCLLIQDYSIAMCWDRFTTDFFFPDGSFGTIISGNFTPAAGGQVDLVYGTYTLVDGTTGDIYNSSLTTEAPPNTSTMPMPTPWTSSGVGSAIPASELGTTGILSTVTTVVSGSRSSISFPSVTIIATETGCGHCWGNATTITGITLPGPTIPATTRIFTTGILLPPGINHASERSVVTIFTLYVFVSWGLQFMLL